MRFLADMGVSQRIVEWLRSEGHDAVHLRDEQLHRLPNGAIFEKAEAERRIILTFDLDFGEIVALSGGYMKETNSDAVMERVDEQGNVLGFTVMGVSRLSKEKPLVADLIPA
jgi:hypothetical protein